MELKIEKKKKKLTKNWFTSILSLARSVLSPLVHPQACQALFALALFLKTHFWWVRKGFVLCFQWLNQNNSIQLVKVLFWMLIVFVLRWAWRHCRREIREGKRGGRGQYKLYLFRFKNTLKAFLEDVRVCVCVKEPLRGLYSL